MPRGVPKAGKRKPRSDKGFKRNGLAIAKNMAHFSEPVHVIPTETDDQVATRIGERFEILEEIVDAALNGDVRSTIVSGPAGLGKSFTVEKAIENWDPSGLNHTIIKGYVKATGLYRLLYRYRMAGQILVFDDADTLYYDDTSLNFLKAVCDTNDRRRVSYQADYKMVDDDTGETLPHSFDFEGTIIFITNLDFDAMIEKGHRLAPHLQAMLSRSHYIDLSMKTRQDYMVRIKQVINQGLLRDRGLTPLQQSEVLKFIEDNQARMRELSLRMALKVATIRKTSQRWENVARVTCCKNMA